MYPEYMMKSIKNVEKTRPQRLEMVKKYGKQVFPAMSEKERDEILNKYHPDYKPKARREVRVGPNKGERLTTKVADMLESHSRIDPKNLISKKLITKLMYWLLVQVLLEWLPLSLLKRTEVMF